MSNAFVRLAAAGTLVLGLATVTAAPGFAKDRTNPSAGGTPASDRAIGDDRARDRMSAQGLANSNGIFMPGRSTGRDRADDRTNRHSLDTGKAGKHAGRDALRAERRTARHADWDAKHLDRHASRLAARTSVPGRGQR